MNVLLLGGNGYLGSKVAHMLVGTGHGVVCTKRPLSDLSRIEDIIDKLTLIPASVDSVESASQYISFDYVINTACNYGRSDSLYDSVIEANIEFPLRVLNKIAESGKCNYLTIGTGLPDLLNMYCFTKKIFNEFGRFYCDKHSVNFCCLTLEMLYGADEPVNRFFPSVIRKMLNGEDVETTIGTQHRDIISVSDVVNAISMVISAGLAGYREIPVGTGEAPSISEIIDFMWEMTGRKSQIKKGAIPMRFNEPDCVADVSILRSIGEWSPIRWKEGIKDMIDTINIQIRGGSLPVN